MIIINLNFISTLSLLVVDFVLLLITRSGSKPFDTLIVLQRDFFLKKADDNKKMKNIQHAKS